MSQESVEYTPAPEVEAVARGLIRQHHPHLMTGVRIEYCFVTKTPRSGGKEVWGTCRKIAGLHAHLAGDGSGDDPFFCITITKPIWDVMDDRQRAALVDHELCHAWVDTDSDGPAKLSTNPHDLEEFGCVVRRHGLWRESVQAFLDDCRRAGEESE